MSRKDDPKDREQKFKSLRISLICLSIFLIGSAIGYLMGALPSGSKTTTLPLRLGGFKLINPLLACNNTDPNSGPNLKSLKEDLLNLAEKEKDANHIEDVSIYFRDLSKSYSVLGINENKEYDQASLAKVPIMMAYLKEAETDPSILKRTILDDLTEDENNTSYFFKSPKPIERGKSYTVEELIRDMIVYSGNNSTYLLEKDLDQALFEDVYKELGLPQPSLPVPKISSRDFSIFFRVLYNATYLSREMSERALELLDEATFEQGLRAGVPDSVDIADKFGERSIEMPVGNVIGRELHDCGIVYHPKYPYFLCIMTQGSDFDSMAATIQKVSGAVFKYFDQNN